MDDIADGTGDDHEATIRQLGQEYAARFGPPRTELIEAGRVRDYLLAMDEAEASDDGPVPPLFLLTLGRSRRPQPARGSAVNAGDEFEFHRPVHVGDRITVSLRVLPIEEKQGRHGVMYLVPREVTYINQHGELVAVSRHSSLRWAL